MVWVGSDHFWIRGHASLITSIPSLHIRILKNTLKLIELQSTIQLATVFSIISIIITWQNNGRNKTHYNSYILQSLTFCYAHNIDTYKVSRYQLYSQVINYPFMLYTSPLRYKWHLLGCRCDKHFFYHYCQKEEEKTWRNAQCFSDFFFFLWNKRLLTV